MSKVPECIFPKPFLVRLADFIENPRDVSVFSRTSKHTLLVCYAYLCRIMGWNRFTRLDNRTFYEKLPSNSYLYYQCIKIQQMIWSRSGRSLVTYDMVINNPTWVQIQRILFFVYLLFY